MQITIKRHNCDPIDISVRLDEVEALLLMKFMGKNASQSEYEKIWKRVLELIGTK